MAITDRTPPNAPAADGIGLRPAVTGDYCCAVCGHRIVGRGPLPDCPMCHEAAWRLVAWRPFSGQRDELGPFSDRPPSR